MKRRSLWAAGVLLLVVGLAGVLAIGTGYAEEENASRAKCSEATLDGTYLFADNGFVIKDNEKVPFASSGYEVYDGNGHTKGVSTTNVNGKVTSKEPFSGTYTVKAGSAEAAARELKPATLKIGKPRDSSSNQVLLP